ncbi:hypothetical protein [Sapientia aquatica]|uniref:Uncharacterized protein n=1 Tax=Sapientia aquatica TaxID=1549640 RepID=A0A4R5W2X8_9BURK|nr:hypothetical protein [Sapientia aquatica]TDK67053.1 hypothetical protein E2I14_04595 [Sapientia aquatica]
MSKLNSQHLTSIGSSLFGLLLSCLNAAHAAAPAALDLTGYVDKQGAISVQFNGDTIDPYFTLQALLLARENGLDISPYAMKWANWMIDRQKPDGTFDRFCLTQGVWSPCKTADADDALMALWLKFLSTMPHEQATNSRWTHSTQLSQANLDRLIDTKRGIYLVSPVYQHGLLMDNLEVLSYQIQPDNKAKAAAAKQLALSIRDVFSDQKTHRFLVSTQAEQKELASAFYPDQVAQIFPLLVDFDFNLLPSPKANYYKQWMKQYRQSWLTQSRHDFAWGVIAVLALKQGDSSSAACWLRESSAAQHTAHWIATDEVARQVLMRHRIEPAGLDVDCN